MAPAPKNSLVSLRALLRPEEAGSGSWAQLWSQFRSSNMSMNKGSGAPEFKKGSGADFCCKKLWKRLGSHGSETRAPAGLRLRTLKMAPAPQPYLKFILNLLTPPPHNWKMNLKIYIIYRVWDTWKHTEKSLNTYRNWKLYFSSKHSELIINHVPSYANKPKILSTTSNTSNL